MHFCNREVVISAFEFVIVKVIPLTVVDLFLEQDCKKKAMVRRGIGLSGLQKRRSLPIVLGSICLASFRIKG